MSLWTPLRERPHVYQYRYVMAACMAGLLVGFVVPLLLTFLAMHCCFLRVTHTNMSFEAMPGLCCFLCVTHANIHVHMQARTMELREGHCWFANVSTC